ncbi:hypothetical protein MIN45_P1320 [Methylomarinovum tepidoasis]|uniref:SMODS-associated and fused to various effectors domain-containing protein n=1 Tax=Methylomarinovum tepidoasis TaxID=2840183 RepID=A0AAU9C955_9GAMM|nr:hypothetical protein [Methylomarinovum sp. IN45]BCX88950.1 hypothetical protein MIN45_P1320 [Methylomarinovum sp. IN45]
MWSVFADFVVTWLDPVGVVLGLIATLPVFWTWYEVVFGERRRRKRWFDEVRRQPGRRPAILVLDLLPGKEIRTQVEHFRAHSDALKDIPEERVFVISREKALTPAEVPALQDEIRCTARRILASGADRVHYFHAGPAFAAALVGAEFANAAPLLLYHYQGGAYRNFGPLRMMP